MLVVPVAADGSVSVVSQVDGNHLLCLVYSACANQMVEFNTSRKFRQSWIIFNNNTAVQKTIFTTYWNICEYCIGYTDSFQLEGDETEPSEAFYLQNLNHTAGSGLKAGISGPNND